MTVTPGNSLRGGLQAAEVNRLKALFSDAVAAHQQGDLPRAAALYKAVLAAAPRHFDTLHRLGVLQVQMGNPAAAVGLIREALALNRQHADALSNLGKALLDLERPEEALRCIDAALKLRPGFHAAQVNKGNALFALKRTEEAIAAYDAVLETAPELAAVHCNRGSALLEAKRAAEALAAFERALAADPGHADAHDGRSLALIRLDRPREALASAEEALRRAPDLAEAHNNRGTALANLRRHAEALACFERAISLDRSLVKAQLNLAITLLELERPADALASLRRAYELDGRSAETLSLAGSVLGLIDQHEESAEAYRRLVEVAPEHPGALGHLLLSRMTMCDWSDYSETLERITRAIGEGRRACVPFEAIALTASPEAQLRCAQLEAAHSFSPRPAPLWTGERYRHDRIRLAYLSADFHNHATSYLMAGLFEAHDRERFEVTAIAFGGAKPDSMRARLQRAFDRFVDVHAMTDLEAARVLRELEIDVAVDLKGYTRDGRSGILVHRPAPVQVNFLGYPGTLGADFVDYLIVDEWVIPPEHHRFYTEQVVTLPNSYQPNDPGRRIAERVPSRAELGLPEQGFVFCCFNNSYKITPRIFDLWMRLLRGVEGSVLWLLEANPHVARNLRSHAERRGVAAERLVFAQRLALAEHLARHARADLFLDTLPCNAHTTSSDALWAGLPVLTCLGETFAGRVAASLLSAVGLPELITRSLPEYEALALALATEPGRLAELRARLATDRAARPLFDLQRYRRHLEEAYAQMVARAERGGPPTGFAVLRQP